MDAERQHEHVLIMERVNPEQDSPVQSIMQYLNRRDKTIPAGFFCVRHRITDKKRGARGI